MKAGDLRYYHTRAVRVSRSALRARAFTEVWNLHRGPKGRKAVTTNADLLVPLKLFARFSVKNDRVVGDELPQYVSVDDVLDGREPVTFAGVLRALMVLRAYDERAFRLFVHAARLLSVQVDDRFVMFPPCYYLLSQSHEYFEEAFRRIEERWDVTVRDYVAALCRSALEFAPDVKDHVALFVPDAGKDDEMVERFATSQGERKE